MGISTYNIATEGVNAGNTYAIASLGYNFDVEIIPIPPTPVPPIEDFVGPGGVVSQQTPPKEERYYRNIIRVSVEIDGVRYTDEKMVEDITVDVNKLKLDVIGDVDRPRISIQL